MIHAVVAANRAARASGERRGIFARRQQVFGRAAEDPNRTELAGLVLTGGYRPRPRDLEAIKGERMFAMIVEADTYEAASSVHDLLVKTHPADREKIALTRDLINEHIDIDAIVARFTEPGAATTATSLPRAATDIAARTVRSVETGLRRVTGRAAGSRSGGRKET